MTNRDLFSRGGLKVFACLCALHVTVSLWCFLIWIPGKTTPQVSYPLPRNLTQILSKVSRNENQERRCDLHRYLTRTHDQCVVLLKNGGVSKDTHNAIFKQGARKFVAIATNLRAPHLNIVERYNGTVNDICGIQELNGICDEVKDSLLYGKQNISDEEKDMPLAFTIKLHSNPNQAYRLLRLIYRTHNVYCIHVDKKAKDEIYEQFKNISKCVDNIIVIEDRVSVTYSTIRQVDAEFRCIDAMLRVNVTWRYYINLTGQEFMLKTNLEIVKILKILNGRNDIESYKMDYEDHKYKQRTFVVGKRAYISKLRKEPFHRNITIRKGSAYGMFSRTFLEFVKSDKVANEFIAWLADTYAPEEMVWATLNALENAPGGYKGEVTQKRNFLSRAVIWSLDNQFSCKGRFVRWVCIYGTGDLPWLLKHRNIVANKFYEDFEPEALDCLETIMYHRMLSKTGTAETFSLEQYADVATLSKPDSFI